VPEFTEDTPGTSLGFLVDLLDFLVAMAGVVDMRFHRDDERREERNAVPSTPL